MVQVTLNLGDKHDYFIIIMLKTYAFSLPALVPLIFNAMLTQWVRQTQMKEQKKIQL